ncbi:MAG: hypothetical protein MR405_07630 [Mollicutes bacterium]|nr:hypothetical protein [Mollicutes bacterium]
MFPHTITIFNLVNDIYNRKVVHNVFSHTDKIISQEGKGEKYTSAHRVIFSGNALNDYLTIDEYNKLSDKTNNFTLKNNDLIVIGEFKEIKELVDVTKTNVDYFLIKTISDNRYGSLDLQNIEVTD